MPQLIVRNLNPRIVAALKARAASRGRSAEAEHREILEHALLGAAPGPDFKTFLRSIPPGPPDSDLQIRRSRDRGRHVRL